MTITIISKENAMFVRLESTPIAATPFDVLFDRGSLFPDINWYGKSSRTEVYPYVNIADVDNTLHVVAEIPGVPKNEINIRLDGDVLTISGERKAPEAAKGATSVRAEITYGAFERSFKLPYEVDGSKVTAEYTNGVLRVVLPKTEAAKPKAIVIQ
jgi:HSP20 family protein